ncbi:MAG: MBL fold metallo-hydrolase [Candidatus Magasanikbacteria bacterium CG11_big_fil_rev_8_21_14_0_20_39_34]|uniref:MBL fold metallo-hydrolase n=1 Tax=Candidatus Magasanikbacteria bacterium CG11_big_fil_rev_8_21_14_0_20_39_34 TaxID=1974653 RepID=A0A2H0N4U7_9BACT|nr:MAG: MBL fold metallo-hydrolase [Candidatus Magasanikbacteria bacterium CG11_big_fil_rev_8_21_14_0_20_39_34]
MKLTFFGAAHEVTGSCHLLQADGKNILLDCGMFQGSDFNEGKNNEKFPFDPKTIDAVVVSHAHLDHTGRIPKLFREGFHGKIYATKATCELANIIWNDAFHIMSYNNKKFQSPILFDEGDIEMARMHCEGVDYGEKVRIGDIQVTFKDAGHIFGSSFLEIEAEGKTIGFSGDLGNSNVPILRDTDRLGKVDILLCESTYGSRMHESEEMRIQMLHDLIMEGYNKGGVIMMPAFSIERTQEILYRLDKLIEHDKALPCFPIFLDSPMAIDSLPVYKKYPEYYDVEASKHYMNDEDFLSFHCLTLTRTVEESKKINNVPNPKMIIAGSGMMTGGRILHHAFRYLSDPNSTLIIVGYQAYGTLGRKLYEGAETVYIFGQEIPVRCSIKAIGALSAHADQQKILSWVRNAEKMPKKVYCIHGEPESSTALAHKLRDELSIDAFVPERNETVEL